MIGRVLLLASLTLLAGCSWYLGKPEVPTTEISIRTNPPGADCALVGVNEYRADVVSPATLMVRNDATPLAVTCTLSGYRPVHGSLTLAGKNWLAKTKHSLSSLGADSLNLLGFDADEPDELPAAPKPVFDATMKPVVPTLIK